jgi:tRNA threonylcarbamoyladenosine biosynthesis protein TsaE
MEMGGPEETERLGARLGALLEVGDIVALFGDLGTGKTTLARGIARGLGFAGEVSSPTFPIVQIYDGPGMRMPLWHVDLYRVGRSDEFVELGLEDARDYAALVIEWPERLGDTLWPGTLRLVIRCDEQGKRALTATVPAAWEGRWPPP